MNIIGSLIPVFLLGSNRLNPLSNIFNSNHLIIQLQHYFLGKDKLDRNKRYPYFLVNDAIAIF